ncbi:MAG: GNAT family N-acetyltransferase [Crocinitomix sp.]|nr:GNAT family N-acetyltransferase [Crocinitomix sp.]
MNIRKAAHNDLPFIVGLLADDDLGKTRESLQIVALKPYELAFDKINADKNQELMVLEDEHSEIIGTFQLSFIQYLTYTGGLRAQIEAVRIRKDKRGLGLGKTMFLWAIERAKERNAHLLQLTTDKKRPDALEFYKSLGFRDSHEGMKLHFEQ